MMQSSKRLYIACISATLVAGCAPTWVKPGANQNDFANDRYACLQQSQQRVSGAYVNAYGGAASEKVVTNDGLFSACMNSRGWSLQSQQQVQQVAAQNRQVAESAKDKYQFIIQQSNSYCSAPEFDAFYKKSPCAPADATLVQLSDNSKITPAQKKALEKLSPALKESNRELAAWYRTYGGPSGNARALVLESIFDAAEKNRLNLYTGKISWGEFNAKRKDLAAEHKTRMSQIK